MPKLNWDTFTASSGELPDLSLVNTTDLAASGSIALDLFGFVAVSAHFALSKGTVSGEDANGVTLTDASVLAFELSGVAPATTAQVFVGVGAVLDVDTGDIDTDDAIGFSAGVEKLTLALVTETTPAAGTTPAIMKKYTGLEIVGLEAGLVGIDGLIAQVSGVNVAVNAATDSTPPTAPATMTIAQKLDWSTFVPTKGELPDFRTGSPTPSTSSPRASSS